MMATTTNMATVRQATVRRDRMMLMMAMGDDDDDNNDGNGAMGDEVDSDGNNEDYGDGRRQRPWQWRDG